MTIEPMTFDEVKILFRDALNEANTPTELIQNILTMSSELGYNAGLNDAWECARKLRHPRFGGFHDSEQKDIFGYENSDDVLTKFTASEAIAKIKEYEEQKNEEQKNEIKQWDEICDKHIPQNKLIVVGIGAWGDLNCVDKEGHAFTLDDKYKKHWKKTGKSYPELANILDQLNKVESEEEE